MKHLLPLLACCACLLATPVAAQDAIAMTGDVQVIRTVDGREQRTAPLQVVPGDRLVFTTTYRNQLDRMVEDFVVTNPLPAAVALLEDGGFLVSVDGGLTYGRVGELTVRENDVARPAVLADATHVRWTIAQIAPGESGEVSYLATVR